MQVGSLIGKCCLVVGVCLATHVAYADVSGRVFRDLNENGSFDSAGNFNEMGVAGVTVKAFDASGAQVASTLSGANGDYNLTGVSGALRLEFTGLLIGDYSSSQTLNNGSNVRFVNAPISDVNYGLNYPNDYCEADPAIVVPIQYAGDGTGASAAKGALQRFPYSTSGGYSPNNTVALTKAQVGSIWSLAYDRNNKRIFQAAFLKRHTGLKNGLGDIYIATQSGSTINYDSSFNLQGVVAANNGQVIDFGSVCRSASCATDAGNTGIANDYIIPADPSTPSIDLDGFAKVGKVGLGGLEISSDNKQLWAVNLYQRSLLRMDATLPSGSLPGNVQAYEIDSATGTPSCANGVFRPFALTFYRHTGYLGGVCDASVSKQPSDLKAYVLAFDPNASSLNFSTVTSFDLNYNRGGDWVDSNAFYHWQWHPWGDKWDDYNITSGLFMLYKAVPMLADIEFSEDGSMTLAFMDRFAHQIGRVQYKAKSQTSSLVDGRSRGDLIHLCKDSSGAYHLEGSAQCPVNFTGGEGPQNNGEYFNDVGGDSYSENALGSIFYLKGSNEMLSTMFDPFSSGLNEDIDSYFTQGIHAFNAKDGNRVDYFRVASSSSGGGFGKGSGLGELEVLCSPAPVEVGNRVWLDKDKDGIQDADELGLSALNVELVCPSGSASTQTDSSGQFTFTTASGGNASFMQVGEACKLRVDNSQAALKTYELTKTNAENDSSNNEQTDLRDSDASLNGNYAELDFMVGGAGANNHSLDFGYREPVLTDIALEKTVTPTQAKHGEVVTYKLTVTNQSSADASNIQIKDVLPAGLNYLSDDGLAQYSSDVFDESTGVWTVGSIAAGISKTLTITVQVQ